MYETESGGAAVEDPVPSPRRQEAEQTVCGVAGVARDSQHRQTENQMVYLLVYVVGQQSHQELWLTKTVQHGQFSY